MRADPEPPGFAISRPLTGRKRASSTSFQLRNPPVRQRDGQRRPVARHGQRWIGNDGLHLRHLLPIPDHARRATDTGPRSAVCRQRQGRTSKGLYNLRKWHLLRERVYLVDIPEDNPVTVVRVDDGPGGRRYASVLTEGEP